MERKDLGAGAGKKPTKKRREKQNIHFDSLLNRWDKMAGLGGGGKENVI